MKKKGFTLIELLAVIVVLAIIALIATPIVLNLINKAKVGAAEASARSYVKAVENYMILSELNPDKYPTKLLVGETYKVNSVTELSFIDKIIPTVYAESNEVYLNDLINLNGSKPDAGFVSIGEKNIVVSASLNYSGKEITCTESNCSYSKDVGPIVLEKWQTLASLSNINFNNYKEESELFIPENINLIFDSKEASDYLINNYEEFNKYFIENKSNLILLGNSEYASYKAVMNDKWRNAITTSEYATTFDSTAVTVPKLIDNTNVIYSSIHNTSFNAYLVFDKNFSTSDKGWLPTRGQKIEDSYIGYNFNTNVVCYKIQLQIGTWNGPKSRVITFESSNDNITYNKIIDDFNAKQDTDIHYYYPTKMIAGKYIKLQGISGNGLYDNQGYDDTINEIQFYCKKVVE